MDPPPLRTTVSRQGRLLRLALVPLGVHGVWRVRLRVECQAGGRLWRSFHPIPVGDEHPPPSPPLLSADKNKCLHLFEMQINTIGWFVQRDAVAAVCHPRSKNAPWFIPALGRVGRTFG